MEEIELMAKIEYPREGDSLFASADDMKLNAVTSICRFDGAMSWFAYTDGYREAAETIFREVDKTRLHQDLVVYPILFLWHHHIELRLKELIWRCQDLTGQARDIGRTHRLNDLWETATRLVTMICPGYAHDPEMARAGVIIGELSDLNFDDNALRYPENREGEFGMPRDHEHINLGVVNEVMCRCANKLGTIADGLSAKKEGRDEERAICRNEGW
jgi:hypothetical protein